MLARPARFLLGLPQISQIYTDNSSMQATVLYSSGLTVKKICVICGKIKHSTLIINKNEKGNNSESNQLRHHRPHCRPQRLLCAELQVIFVVLPQISQIAQILSLQATVLTKSLSKNSARSRKSVKICVICGTQTLILNNPKKQ